MIIIRCAGIKGLKVELAAYLSENMAVVAAVKADSIAIDPLVDTIGASEVSVHVNAFLAREDLAKNFAVRILGKEIVMDALSDVQYERKEHDTDLLVCPHCGKISPYEEEMSVHIRAHYII